MKQQTLAPRVQPESRGPPPAEPRTERHRAAPGRWEMAGSRGLSPKAAPLGRPRAPAPVPRPFASSPPPSFSLSFSPLSASPFFFFLLLSYFLRAPTALLFPRSEFFFPFQKMAGREREREGKRAREGEEGGEKKKKGEERKKERNFLCAGLGGAGNGRAPARAASGRARRQREQEKEKKRQKKKKRVGRSGGAGKKSMGRLCPAALCCFVAAHKGCGARGAARGSRTEEEQKKREGEEKKRRKKPASAFPKWVLPSLPSSPAPLPPSRSRGPMLATHPRASNK